MTPRHAAAGAALARSHALSRRLHNKVGLRYGKLTVLREVRVAGRQGRSWECACDCGRLVTVVSTTLNSGKSGTKSCGCTRAESMKAVWSGNVTHGHSSPPTPTYNSWRDMLARCRNSKSENWKYYGGRGIKVCERWSKFEHFLADVGVSPGAGWTIDRIDGADDYRPGNCRWATYFEQNNNLSSNRRMTLDGRTQTLTAWAAEAGVTCYAITQRIARGWPLRDALTLPRQHGGAK